METWNFSEFIIFSKKVGTPLKFIEDLNWIWFQNLYHEIQRELEV
jgi:hypothetical protein